ncbi:hypothetical protein [Fulvivirga sp. M361]|uniref:hypothetical protein n=1 Tax=Fulvivirga sp. M361 TaxID=2594266 RepID=UPI001625645F|nr:hypothetical protein [Fulvivirga sp. M361]
MNGIRSFVIMTIKPGSFNIYVADYTRIGNNPGGGGDLDAISISFDATFIF